MKSLIEWIIALFARRAAAQPAPKAHISEDCLAMIKHWEGCRLTAYLDPADVPTIGYGDTGQRVRLGQTITQAEADARLLERVVREFEPGVLGAIKRSMTQYELDAMVSLAYNIGVGAFSSSTLVRKFNAGDRDGASAQFRVWRKAGGRVLLGLERRRVAEQALFDGVPVDEAIKRGQSYGAI